MSALDYRRVLEVMGDPIIVGDRTGRITYANPAAERLLGWEPGELVGKPLTAIIPPSLRGRHTSGFNRYRSTWVPRIIGRAIRVPVLKRNGTEARVELSLSAFRGQGGDELYLATLRAAAGPRPAGERSESPTTRLRGLVLLAAALTQAADPAQLQRRASELLSAHFGAVFTRLWLPDTATEALRAVGRGYAERELGEDPSGTITRAANTPVAEVARTGTTLIRNEVGNDPPFDATWLAARNAQSAAIFPLSYSGMLEGVFLYLGGEALTDELTQGLEAATGLITGALRELRARDTAADGARLRGETAAYQEITTAIARSQPSDEVLELLLQRSLELTETDEGSLLFPEPDGGYVVRVCAGYPTPIYGLKVPAGMGVSHLAATRKQVTSVEDYQAFAEAVPRIRQRGVQAVLAAPVLSGSEVAAVLKVESKRKGRTFGENEEAIIRAMSHLAAIALRMCPPREGNLPTPG